MPNLHVQLLVGRTPEQKTSLLEELTATMVRCLGVEPERVTVQLSEFAEGMWSRGGVALEVNRTGLNR